ncbi:hypothetical protein [Hyalangium sp.]|uniref:hypothetical protein n=1 Tax=Hyalangium sp. TaxID=2028555 RepID=UPI002D67CC0A|nr:hypothetical protein [Hyalangium sp.]HYH97053.1 hypothetical protein [Hyalangium sp.]
MGHQGSRRCAPSTIDLHVGPGDDPLNLLQPLETAQKERELGVRHLDYLVISVWHHRITGNEKIQADAFLGRLLQADVRVCLHGHVHEDRADLVNYLDPVRRLHVVGAGSFGAPTHHGPESIPHLFKLLEVSQNLSDKHTGSRPAPALRPSMKRTTC